MLKPYFLDTQCPLIRRNVSHAARYTLTMQQTSVTLY